VTRAERLIDAASDCFGEGAGEAAGGGGREERLSFTLILLARRHVVFHARRYSFVRASLVNVSSPNFPERETERGFSYLKSDRSRVRLIPMQSRDRSMRRESSKSSED